MNILIVEDETLAHKKLQLLIEKLLPDANIVGIAKSIDDAVSIVKAHNIDLGFFDIQIEDGLSFDIFDKILINFPVIFTTAFNEYAIKAFKLNSVDYLLKPILEVELKNALNKFDKVWQVSKKPISQSIIDEMKQLLGGKVDTIAFLSRKNLTALAPYFLVTL